MIIETLSIGLIIPAISFIVEIIFEKFDIFNFIKDISFIELGPITNLVVMSILLL